MNVLNEEFKEQKIEVTNIQFSVRDEKINSNSDETFDLISLFNRDFKDTLLKKVVIDVNLEDDMDKIVNAINKMEE
ncbi:MAG: hypothetical protein BZ136_09325 [Methanosphaera sp. rholeuAM74]|nr:MAG: hypothetical protein BZ136_09325 [Methanosphaera sp. rholeuAM74]